MDKVHLFKQVVQVAVGETKLHKCYSILLQQSEQHVVTPD